LQTVPGAQGVPLLTQESAASSQDSVPLQKAPSSAQTTGVPSRQPFCASHNSFPLQNSPSLQAASLGVLSHRSKPSLQESVVQATLSLQSTGVPAWHCPVLVLQVSTPEQNDPSLHSSSVLHPTTAQVFVSSLHTSGGVQGSPLLTQESVASLQDSVPLQYNSSSGQLTGVPGTQPLAVQTSAPLQ
jgi:hypothetical protein